MTEETVPAETPAHESEPLAENPTSEPTSSIESSTPAAEPTSSPVPTGQAEETGAASTEAKPQESTLHSLGDQIAAEVEAAVADAKAEGESALQSQLAEVEQQAEADKESAIATLKEQFEADKQAAVAEATRAVSTLLVHGENLAKALEAAIPTAQAGLATLNKSSVNPIVSSAVEALEAHIASLTGALNAFKMATGKN